MNVATLLGNARADHPGPCPELEVSRKNQLFGVRFESTLKTKNSRLFQQQIYRQSNRAIRFMAGWWGLSELMVEVASSSIAVVVLVVDERRVLRLHCDLIR